MLAVAWLVIPIVGMLLSSNNNNKSGRMNRCRLIWHRRDLRLHDNELYSNLDRCVSLFVFDPQYFKPTKSCIDGDFETVWCGPHAAQALIEAVTSLRESIRSIGGELLVRSGDPSVLIPKIAQEMDATEIVFGEEPGTYEREVVQRLQQHYLFDPTASNIKLMSKVGYTLYHPDDLPTEPNEWDRLAHPKMKQGKKKKQKQHTSSSLFGEKNDFDLVDVSPERFKGINRIMGDFRKAAKRATVVRNILDPPQSLLLPEGFDASQLKDGAGSIPTLEQLTRPLQSSKILGVDQDKILSVVQSAIRNRDNNFNEVRSEANALKRLDMFLHYYASSADRSRADVSNNDSSRFSVHLALGTLSPRTVYWRSQAYDEEGCNWIASHLEMRDFFLYTAFANGSRMYFQRGLPVSKKKQKEPIQWNSPKDDVERWTRWATGVTQLPLIDAAMKELLTTGYISNRVRQNAASVLTKDLNLDWRVGAEWFQFLLEDHCVGANFGNWLYFSGVGPDPKNRHFRTVSQAKRYDEHGEYVKRWIPSLREVPHMEHALRPWDFGVAGFEAPVVDPKTQYTWQDTQLLESNGTLFLEDS